MQTQLPYKKGARKQTTSSLDRSGGELSREPSYTSSSRLIQAVLV